MMNLAPKSKHNYIIQKLNEILNHIDIGPFRFQLNGFKEDAKRMFLTEPELAYTILGIIACIEDDLESMHKNHQNAIRLSGESLYTLKQYSASLAEQGLFDQAYKYAHKAYEKTKDDRDVLILLMDLAYSLEKTYEYEVFKKKVIKLGFDFHDPNDFPEDSDDFLQEAFSVVDKTIKNNPELIFEPDPEFEALVDELVDGVDIS